MVVWRSRGICPYMHMIFPVAYFFSGNEVEGEVNPSDVGLDGLIEAVLSDILMVTKSNQKPLFVIPALCHTGLPPLAGSTCVSSGLTEGTGSGYIDGNLSLW